MLDRLDLGYEDDEEWYGRPGRHRRRKKRGGRSTIALVLVLVLLGGLVGAGVWGFGAVKDFFAAADYNGAGEGSVTVQVEPGQGAAEIGNTLFSKKVVKSARAFVNAADDDSRSRNLQPGFYRLKLKMKAKLALNMLLDPKNKALSRVTLPEGLTMMQTFQKLSDSMKLPVTDFQAAAKDPAALGVPDSWFVRKDGKQAGKTIEGFLCPGQYDFDPGTSAKQALTQMVQRFMAAAQQNGIGGGTGNFSPYETLIIASLTQAEGIESDFGKISQVVQNRLKADPPLLGFDSTTNYWLQLNGKPTRDSRTIGEALNDPNNTYSTTLNRGLPPTPINSPSPEAMTAAMHPTAGSWLYFVKIDKQGHSAFENTPAEHDADIAKAHAAGVY